jgi:hypothetical protein
MPDIRTRSGAVPEPHAGDAAAEALTAALARQGFDRADEYGGLAVRGHLSGGKDVWLTLGGRLSGSSAARLAAILDAAAVGESDLLTEWRAGHAVAASGVPVPPRGSVVLDVTQIDRPGRVEDWDGRGRMTLRPPVGGEPWSVALGDVRPVDADVDTRLLDR